MARGPRGASWSSEYRRRIEQRQSEGFTKGQARGHPERGLPSIGEAKRAEAAIRRSVKEPEVIFPKDRPDRVVVRTTNADGSTSVHITTRKRWNRITRGRRRDVGPDGAPIKIWQYVKRRKPAA